MASNHYNKFINIAINQAINNKSSVTSKHCAVLVKNGKYICDAPNVIGVHAELNCLKIAMLKGS